jgi:hypothetical protein
VRSLRRTQRCRGIRSIELLEHAIAVAQRLAPLRIVRCASSPMENRSSFVTM